MKKRTKKYINSAKKVDTTKEYKFEDALKAIAKASYSKFKGTVEMHISINVPAGRDPKSIKGSVTLPFVQTKDVKIAVAVPENLEETAKKAGADIYNLDSIIKDVKSGKIPFDVLIAVPQVMPKLAPLGKALGPKGLMPNPKNGTVVTPDKLEETIKEFKKGKLIFKADSAGGIHVAIGKIDDPADHLLQNAKTVIHAIISTLGKSKEALIKSIYLAPTMGVSVKIDLKSI